MKLKFAWFGCERIANRRAELLGTGHIDVARGTRLNPLARVPEAVSE